MFVAPFWIGALLGFVAGACVVTIAAALIYFYAVDPWEDDRPAWQRKAEGG